MWKYLKVASRLFPREKKVFFSFPKALLLASITFFIITNTSETIAGKPQKETAKNKEASKKSRFSFFSRSKKKEINDKELSTPPFERRDVTTKQPSYHHPHDSTIWPNYKEVKEHTPIGHTQNKNQARSSQSSYELAKGSNNTLSRHTPRHSNSSFPTPDRNWEKKTSCVFQSHNTLLATAPLQQEKTTRYQNYHNLTRSFERTQSVTNVLSCFEHEHPTSSKPQNPKSLQLSNFPLSIYKPQNSEMTTKKHSYNLHTFPNKSQTDINTQQLSTVKTINKNSSTSRVSCTPPRSRKNILSYSQAELLQLNQPSKAMSELHLNPSKQLTLSADKKENLHPYPDDTQLFSTDSKVPPPKPPRRKIKDQKTENHIPSTFPVDLSPTNECFASDKLKTTDIFYTKPLTNIRQEVLLKSRIIINLNTIIFTKIFTSLSMDKYTEEEFSVSKKLETEKLRCSLTWPKADRKAKRMVVFKYPYMDVEKCFEALKDSCYIVKSDQLFPKDHAFQQFDEGCRYCQEISTTLLEVIRHVALQLTIQDSLIHKLSSIISDEAEIQAIYLSLIISIVQTISYYAATVETFTCLNQFDLSWMILLLQTEQTTSNFLKEILDHSKMRLLKTDSIFQSIIVICELYLKSTNNPFKAPSPRIQDMMKKILLTYTSTNKKPVFELLHHLALNEHFPDLLRTVNTWGKLQEIKKEEKLKSLYHHSDMEEASY